VQQSELKARLKGDKLGGVYLFCGEEEYLKRHYLSEIRKKVLTDPALSPFNHLRFEGESIDFGALLDAVKAPPMMADYKLIEWEGANIAGMSESAHDAFSDLVSLAKEHPFCVLVFRVTAEELPTGTAKRPSPLFRRLSEIADAVNFESPGAAQLAAWLSSHFSHEGLQPTAEALRRLPEQCGHSMSILANEVDKLACFCRVHGTYTVTADMVEQICSSTAEDDAFGLTNALLSGDLRTAYKRLVDLKRRRVDPRLILGQLVRFFSDMASVAMMLSEGAPAKSIAAALSMNEYKLGLYIKGAGRRSVASLRHALDRCREVDLASKTGADPMALLERLLSELA
jgi:DNA polymerase-3 subunit delta